MSGMPAFDGRRDNVDYINQTLASGWTGSVAAARDRRTVTVDIDATKTSGSWGALAVIATLDEEFWPTRVLYGDAMLASTGTLVPVIFNTDGTVTTVQAGTSTLGLTGYATYVQ